MQRHWVFKGKCFFLFFFINFFLIIKTKRLSDVHFSVSIFKKDMYINLCTLKIYKHSSHHKFIYYLNFFKKEFCCKILNCEKIYSAMFKLYSWKYIYIYIYKMCVCVCINSIVGVIMEIIGNRDCCLNFPLC